MAHSSFAALAAVRHARSYASAILVAFISPMLYMVGSGLWSLLCERLSVLDMGTAVYRHAQWAATVGAAAWMCALLSLGTWLLSISLRQALGLASEARNKRSPFRRLRPWIAVPLILWLLGLSLDEFHLRGDVAAPQKALVLGFVLCLMFAHDVPRLVRNALSALRSRGPLLAVPFRALAAVPPAGRVHTRGTIVAGPTVISAPGGPCVYRRQWNPPLLSDAPAVVEAVSFQLADQGARAFVEVDPARLIVEVVAAPTSGAAPGSAPDRTWAPDPRDAQREGGYSCGRHSLSWQARLKK